MAKDQGTTLSQQDLLQLAQLPSAQTIAGGINAMNQAAFGNPVPPSSQFGIVPTAPLPAPVTVQPPPGAPPPQQPTPGGTPGGQFFNGQTGTGFGIGQGPRGDRSQTPARVDPNTGKITYGGKLPQTEMQAAVAKLFGLGPQAAAPKPSTPPPPPPTPATPQHVQSAGQAMGIRDPNATPFGRALHAQGQPPLTVEGLSRVAHAYQTALAGDPVNTPLAEQTAMAHLDVERALAPLGGISPIAHGGAA